MTWADRVFVVASVAVLVLAGTAFQFDIMKSRQQITTRIVKWRVTHAVKREKTRQARQDGQETAAAAKAVQTPAAELKTRLKARRSARKARARTRTGTRAHYARGQEKTTHSLAARRGRAAKRAAVKHITR